MVGERSGAIERAMATLESLVALGATASLAEVAARAGVPKATAHRILRTLIALGYARQVGDGMYAPGLRILTLAGQIEDTLDLAAHARRPMRVLQELVPETVHFAVLDGRRAMYVEKLEGGRAFRMASRVGMTIPLHSTAIGKAILAFLDPNERAERLEESLEPRTARTITSRARLEDELERVRATGFAIDDEENEEQVRCVGAAVFDHRGATAGAVSVSAPAFAFSLEEAHRLGPAVVGAAGAISLALGARPEQLPASYAGALWIDAVDLLSSHRPAGSGSSRTRRIAAAAPEPSRL